MITPGMSGPPAGAASRTAGTAPPVVAIIGRPNVGKSALFNRIVGTDAAIVTEHAGTTRDRHFALTDWSGRAFYLVDTGGLVQDSSLPMDVEIRRQVQLAMDEADLLLFVVDARTGIHPGDRAIADMLRAADRPWLLVANKVDDPESTDFYEFYELGAGDPLPVSAANGKQSGDLLDEIVKAIPQVDADEASTELRVAVVGRPNVGKSSFVNRLLGEERLVVSDVAGTTRDAIDTPLRYHGRDLIFIDTAGLRRQSKVDEDIEFYSTLRTRRAIERAHICILVLDATLGLEVQDLKIANLAWEAGRGLIIVVNKWDIAEKDERTAAQFEKDAAERVPFLKWVPFLFVSAITGQRVQRVLDVILEVDAERNRRVDTSEVNLVLEQLLQRRQPPQAAGREVKLNYATQVEVAPPAIVVFGNEPALVQEHYVRYLHNGFRAAFGFKGNPLRIILRRKN